MSKITIKKIGITNVGTDCIVNAANEGLWEGGGVCGVIFKAAGSAQLTKACNAIGGCKTGSAVITPAFNLNARYIIHAVGPVWKDGSHKEPQQLYGCYKKSLELAKDNGCHSIGFPLISAGIFGYPLNKAWRKAIQACNDFVNENPDYQIDIVFAVIDDHVLEVGQATLEDIVGNNPINVANNDLQQTNLVDEDTELLKAINRAQLKAGIDFFCECRLNSVTKYNSLGMFVQIMEPDMNYMENYEKYCKDVLPTDMNARQIRTMLTWLNRADHFGYDYLSRYVEDGSVLKYFLRLDDLIKRLD